MQTVSSQTIIEKIFLSCNKVMCSPTSQTSLLVPLPTAPPLPFHHYTSTDCSSKRWYPMNFQDTLWGQPLYNWSIEEITWPPVIYSRWYHTGTDIAKLSMMCLRELKMNEQFDIYDKWWIEMMVYQARNEMRWIRKFKWQLGWLWSCFLLIWNV